VDLRKNRAKPKRDKAGWTRQFREGDRHIDESATVESVRAKGDLSRRRTIIVGDARDAALREGLVVALRGLIAEVEENPGPRAGDAVQTWACTVRRVLRTRLIKERHPIAVGDRVKFAPVEVAGETGRFALEGRELPEAVIEAVEPRRTTLVRQYERKVHAVAANVDVVVIVASANAPTLRPHLIDRYMVMAHHGGMRPVVCINKADLDADGAAAAVAKRYRCLGYRAIMTCVLDGLGLDELCDAVRDATSVFVGQSGVGKSSLLNALAPGFRLRVGELTEMERGRHTTTTAQLLKWPFGGHVVDTPGVRQFEFAEIEAHEIDDCFVEFVDLIPRCRFAGCSHTHEVGCAVKQAVEEGRIAPERYDSYCKMYEECAEKPRY